MPNISIQVNDSAVRNLLSRAPGQISIAMRSSLEDASTYVLGIMRRYPSPPAGSTYRRTNTLNRSWSRRVLGSGLNMQAVIGSSGAIAPYNRYVQDRRRQAAIHRGRWRTADDVAEQERTRVVRFFEDRLRAAGLER